MTSWHWRRPRFFTRRPSRATVRYIFARNCIPFSIYSLSISGLNIRAAVFSSRLGGRHSIIRRGAGLVPQNLRGGNHKSQCTPPQPSWKHPHQMCHTETEGGKLNTVSLVSALDLHLKATHTLAVNTFRKLEHHINIQQFHSLSWIIKCFVSLPKSSFRFPQFCFKSFCHRLYYQSTSLWQNLAD